MLIGLCGCKQVGKDTAAQWLVEEQGYTRLAFADKLKEAVANLFNLTIQEIDILKTTGGRVVVDDDVTPLLYTSYSLRVFLQRFGTEMGRNTFGRHFWIGQWLDAFQMIDHDTPVVVTDVRFENEARQIKIEGGFIIQIVRPGYNPDGHASEERLSEHLIDAYVENNTNLDEFKAKFLATIEGLSIGVVG